MGFACLILIVARCSQYEHLPIYREAFQFLIYCETIVQHFSRYHKYTHGSDLRDTARTVIKLIIRANNQSDKEPALEELRVTIEELKVIIRICKEVKAFNSFNSFETAINQVTGISRQGDKPFNVDEIINTIFLLERWQNRVNNEIADTVSAIRIAPVKSARLL